MPKPSIIEQEGDLLTIRTAQGHMALVDAADREIVSGFAWQSNIRHGATHVVRRYREGSAIRTEFLHRRLLNAPAHLFVDHIDGNPLNNRRANLRLCTPAENSANKHRGKTSHTGVVGVYRGHGDYFYTRIRIDGRLVNLGRFATIEEAKAAYDAARPIRPEYRHYPEERSHGEGEWH